MSFNKKQWLVPIAFANIFIIWGSTFLAISYGLKGFPPFVLSGFRFLAAGIILLSWLVLKGEKPNSWKNWKKNAITGILILTGGTGLVAWGEQYVSSTEAAIAIATGPFWFIAIDRKNWRYYFSDKFISIGLLIGFTGLILFLKGSVGSGENAGGNTTARVIAFIVMAISSISWVLGSLYAKNRPSSHSTLMNIAQQLSVAGIASLIIASFKGEWTGFDLAEVAYPAWLGLAFLVFFGSIIGYLSYIWLLSVKPPALVSTHTYINPIVAVVLGWIVVGETISNIQFVGLLVILSGVLLTNFNHYKIPKRRQVKIRQWNRFLWRRSHLLSHDHARR